MEIQGYENYLIYEDGRVWSKKRKKFMKATLSIWGYLRISFCKNGKTKFESLHRLIALQYIPNPDNKPEVDHIDRNRVNNSISNLRWVTKSEQNRNRKAYSNTGEKYIYLKKRKGRNDFYYIEKKGYFCKSLTANKYTLEDVINVRNELLIKHNIV